MVGYGQSRQEKFTVPAGKRAVVRFANFSCFVQSTVSAFLYVHGIPVVLWNPPGAASCGLFEGRWVAYAGEAIIAVIGAVDMGYAVDGFLFEDAGGRPDDADNVITPLIRAETLPGDELWRAGSQRFSAA
jgi:hypothetical protein